MTNELPADIIGVQIRTALSLRGYRLEVRTRDFQSLNRGSIPRIPTSNGVRICIDSAEVVELADTYA